MKTTFFGIAVAVHSLGAQTVALIAAIILGGLIGLERELRGQAAGLRTHILVCVGATLITITSVELARVVPGSTPDVPGRMAANVVVGIGFLGAGAIVREGMTIHGLTTAASIWVTAAIGIALGVGPRMAEDAVLATAIVLLVLVVLNRLEDMLKVKQRVRMLEMELTGDDTAAGKMLGLLADWKFTVYGIEWEAGDQGSESGRANRRLRLRVRLPAQFDRGHFNTAMAQLSGLKSFHMD